MCTGTRQKNAIIRFINKVTKFYVLNKKMQSFKGFYTLHYFIQFSKSIIVFDFL